MIKRQRHHLVNSRPATDRSATDDVIDRRGFALVAVGFDQCALASCQCGQVDDGFTYTIGLADHDMPELVVTGLSPVHALQLTRHVYDHARRGEPFLVGQRAWLGAAPFTLRDVSDHWLANDPSRMAAWFAHTGRSPRLDTLPMIVQVVWGDADGHFPGDPACDPFVAEGQHIIADDPFGFPRITARVHRRHGRHAVGPAHQRSA